jgi:hypothetical protein
VDLQLPVRLLAVSVLAIAAPISAGVPVELTGETAADGTLQHDILQTITLYGAAFKCPAPSRVRASMLNASMIPSDAAYSAPSLAASYEEWDANFCGKDHRFFVKFWPDAQGGSFMSVSYPYPAGAPSAISR